MSKNTIPEVMATEPPAIPVRDYSGLTAAEERGIPGLREKLDRIEAKLDELLERP